MPMFYPVILLLIVWLNTKCGGCEDEIRDKGKQLRQTSSQELQNVQTQNDQMIELLRVFRYLVIPPHNQTNDLTFPDV